MNSGAQVSGSKKKSEIIDQMALKQVPQVEKSGVVQELENETAAFRSRVTESRGGEIKFA
jgi:hypothetical protein